MNKELEKEKKETLEKLEKVLNEARAFERELELHGAYLRFLDHLQINGIFYFLSYPPLLCQHQL